MNWLLIWLMSKGEFGSGRHQKWAEKMIELVPWIFLTAVVTLIVLAIIFGN